MAMRLPGKGQLLSFGADALAVGDSPGLACARRMLKSGGGFTIFVSGTSAAEEMP